MDPLESPATGRLNLGAEGKNGVAQLVLTLVKFLHELLERRALARMDEGSLTDEEIERLGLALMRQAEEIERLRKEFGLTDEDLNLDLGPLGKLL
ncbi:MAG: gas vesicle protein K [Deltaproteobacteria bacterium]|nr:gas vesicle protein K [Deltaproteobacteria bacterium]